MKAEIADKLKKAAAIRTCEEFIFAEQSSGAVGQQSGEIIEKGLRDNPLLSALSTLHIGQRVVLPICAATAVYLIYKLIKHIKQKKDERREED